MAINFNRAEEYLEKTTHAFQKIISIKINKPRNFTHPVGFRGPCKTAIRNGKIYIGEAAGFQDAFAGFGMVYAARSGFLAAKSIVEDRDFDQLWREDFGALLNTSLVNRMVYEILENRITLTLLVSFLDKKRDLIFPLLRWWYQPTWIKTRLYQFLSSSKNVIGPLVYGQRRFRQNLIWFSE